MKPCPKHKLDKIREIAGIIKLGYADFRVHYNGGSMVVEILDIQPKKSVQLGQIK